MHVNNTCGTWGEFFHVVNTGSINIYLLWHKSSECLWNKANFSWTGCGGPLITTNFYLNCFANFRLKIFLWTFSDYIMYAISVSERFGAWMVFK